MLKKIQILRQIISLFDLRFNKITMKSILIFLKCQTKVCVEIDAILNFCITTERQLENSVLKIFKFRAKFVKNDFISCALIK